jgi:hypothetical protein
VVHSWTVDPKGQRQLIRAVRRQVFWSRAGLRWQALVALIVWPGLWLYWAMTTTVEHPFTDQTGLKVAGVLGALCYLATLLLVRWAVARHVVRYYPVWSTAHAAMDEGGLRVANGLGETYRRWDQMEGAQSSRGVLGLPDRLASRSKWSMTMPTTWIPRALVADEVYVRLGLDVPAAGVVVSSEVFPVTTTLAPARTWQVTEESQRTLARDSWLASVTPKLVVLQVAFAVIALGSIAEWVLWAFGDYQPSGMPIPPLILAMSIVGPWWSSRRQVRVLFPIGAEVSVRIDNAGLRLVAAVDERLIPWPLLRGCRRRGAALTYPNPVAPLMREVIPAELVPDDVLVRLGCRPFGTQLVEPGSVSAGQ